MMKIFTFTLSHAFSPFSMSKTIKFSMSLFKWRVTLNYANNLFKKKKLYLPGQKPEIQVKEGTNQRESYLA